MCSSNSLHTVVAFVYAPVCVSVCISVCARVFVCVCCFCCCFSYKNKLQNNLLVVALSLALNENHFPCCRLAHFCWFLYVYFVFFFWQHFPPTTTSWHGRVYLPIRFSQLPPSFATCCPCIPGHVFFLAKSLHCLYHSGSNVDLRLYFVDRSYW